jgi:cell division septation protein DedD
MFVKYKRGVYMPWQNNGDYYCFKEQDIEVHAPPASGVYGLYNFRHHITIGASANIHEALLRHLRDSTFRFHRFEPTGFTFEVCPKESREGRRQQLILEYHPITQSRGGIGLRSLWRSWLTPSARAFDSQITLTRQEYHQKHVPTEMKTAPTTPFIGARFSRDRFLLAGAICSVALLVVILFAMLPYLKSSPRMLLWQILSAIHRTTSAEEQARVRSLSLSRETEMAGERPTADNGPSGLEHDRNTQQKTEEGIDPFAAENSAPAATTPPENPVTEAVKGVPAGTEEPGNRLPAPSLEKTGRHWAVQIMATPYPGVAAVWMEKLNAKGYDAFVVEAEIDSKIWYRVRLGTFKTRRDAEALGALVRLKEGFHDAFVADNTKSEIGALERP